jgi:uncharacterized protein with von Willebrand factor type A (vWA) domain
MVNKGYGKYPSLSALPKEVLEDTLCLVAQGKTNCFKYMASDLEISRNAIDRYKKGEVNNIEHTEAQMFKLKMDIIHFAESDIVEQYIESKSLSLEEKFDFVCQIFSAIIENQKNGRQPNGGMGGGATGQNVSKIFSSFGFLFEHIMNYSYDAPEDNGKTENTGSTKDMGHFDRTYKEILDKKLKIKQMVQQLLSNENASIFEIAKNLETSFFSQSKRGKLYETENISSNLHYSKMKKMNDVSKAVKFEVTIDDVLDRKIMTKSLRVMKYKERKDLKQCLYALLDRSGSTHENNRQMFIKAVAIALAKKAMKDGTTFYCRWFEGRLGSLFVLKGRAHWNTFLDFILNTHPDGGTDMDMALTYAVKDIDKNEIDGLDKSDIIMVTDGTEDIRIPTMNELIKHRVHGKKFHFVFLEDMGNIENCNKLSESLSFMDTGNIEDLSQAKLAFRSII